MVFKKELKAKENYIIRLTKEQNYILDSFKKGRGY